MDEQFLWIRYKDLYMLWIVPSRGHRKLSKHILYILYKNKGIDIATLMAKVGAGWDLSVDQKNFVHSYMRKLKAYGLVIEKDGRLFAAQTAVPVDVVIAAAQRQHEVLAKFYSEETIRAWIKKKRYPPAVWEVV